jgi:hypothetical protein
VDFNANGTELAAGGQDWAVRVWNMPELRTMLTENASDLLSESEQETGLTIIDHDVEPLPVKKLREPSVIISKLP